MSEDKSIQIVLENDELEAAQASARTAGVDFEIQPKSQFIDPVSIILVAGGVWAIGVFVVELLDRRHGGIIIDLRPSAQQLVRRDRSVPYGWALVIAVDGTVSINVHDAPKSASERLIGEIIQGVLKSASDVAAAAAKAIGADKVKQN
jgi:hypothetical protein